MVQDCGYETQDGSMAGNAAAGHAGMRRIVGAVATATLLVLGLQPSEAGAAMLIRVAEDAAGVTFVGSGSVNLTGLTKVDSDIGVSSIDPGNSQIVVGGAVDFYGYPSIPGQFGAIGGPVFATSSSGDAFGLTFPFIGLPAGYVSGADLAFSLFFSGQTLDSLTLVTGSYVWSWGSGADADSVTLQIGAPGATVPEPASVALLGAGLLGIAGLRRRRR